MIVEHVIRNAQDASGRRGQRSVRRACGGAARANRGATLAVDVTTGAGMDARIRPGPAVQTVRHDQGQQGHGHRGLPGARICPVVWAAASRCAAKPGQARASRCALPRAVRALDAMPASRALRPSSTISTLYLLVSLSKMYTLGQTPRPGDRVAEDKPKLLIVEDDPGLQKQLKWCFDEYEVHRRRIARRRPSRPLRRHEPPVVLQDLGLPPDPEGVTEGMATLLEILKLAPHTKVIVVTGQDDKRERGEGRRSRRLRLLPEAGRHRRAALIVQRAFQIHELEAARTGAARSASASAARRRHRHERGDAEGLPHRSRRSRRPTRRCCCSARAAPARSCWRARMHTLSPRASADVRRDQLRGDPGDAARKRAVRLREGRVHRRRQADAGQVRAGRRRHAVPRRDRRHAAARCRPSCCASCRSASSSASAAASASRSTCASSARRTRTCRR